MRKLFLPAILFVLLIAVCIRTSAPSKSAFAFQTGQAECVVDASSLRILHEKNAETPLPNASTTKILTAIIILEDCDLDERICIPNEAAGTEGLEHLPARGGTSIRWKNFCTDSCSARGTTPP